MAALTGRQLAGAEAELAAHFDCGQNEVPLELFEGERHEFADAPTPAPATVTTALRPITPAIFARSLAPRLGIAMPRAAGGTFTEARVSTNLTAAAKGKGDDTDSTAAAITVQTSTVKRVSARMSVRQEDVIAIGLAGFESALRMNLEAVLSDALDDQIVQGDGTGDNLSGLLSLLANPADPTSVPDWEDWAEQQAALVDGLWATTLKEVAMLVGPATYRKAAATFQGTTDKGELSAASYLMAQGGGFWTSKRMPAEDGTSKVQQAIAIRSGLNVRAAVLPSWGRMQIADPYTGAGKAERYLTLHVFLGDVLLIHGDDTRFKQIAFKVDA